MSPKKVFSFVFYTVFYFSLITAQTKSYPEKPPSKLMLHNAAQFSSGALATIGKPLYILGLAEAAATVLFISINGSEGLKELNTNVYSAILSSIGICTVGHTLNNLSESIRQFDKKYISKDKEMFESGAGYFIAGCLAPLAAIAYTLRDNSNPTPEITIS